MISIAELHRMFTRINADCVADGDEAIPFSDVDFYSYQIEAIFGDDEVLTEAACDHIARELARYAESVA